MVGGWARGLPKVAAGTGLPSVAAAGEPRAARVAVVAPFGDPGAYAKFGGVAT